EGLPPEPSIFIQNHLFFFTAIVHLDRHTRSPVSSTSSISHIWEERPLCRHVAVAVITPSCLVLRWLALISMPKVISSSAIRRAAPMLAADSASTTLAPPWRYPYGCRTFFDTGISMTITPASSRTIRMPSTSMSPFVSFMYITRFQIFHDGMDHDTRRPFRAVRCAFCHRAGACDIEVDPRSAVGKLLDETCSEGCPARQFHMVCDV